MTLVFLSALTLAFSGAMMPGPLLTYTIKQALSVGIIAGFVVIFGHSLLEILLIGLIFLGFDTILQSQIAQVSIALVGGILLVYMGANMMYGAIKNNISIELDGDVGGHGNMIWSGFFLSAINPYFLLWWAIIGLGFLLQAYTAYGPKGVIVFYSGHVLADYIWYCFLSFLIGSTRKFIPQTLYRILLTLLGLMLIYFGLSFVINVF